MLNEQTLSTLNALKLFGMAKSFSDTTLSSQPSRSQPPRNSWA